MLSPEFSPVTATAGGVLIGLAASLMLLANGRIAGISGIFKGILDPTPGDLAWRLAFIGGLVLAGLGFAAFAPEYLVATADRSVAATAVAGLLVGVGVTLGNGCTSGHGVCGLSRGSQRSVAATVTFMATGFVTASAIQFVLGGAV
jgi:hypothetical protein